MENKFAELIIKLEEGWVAKPYHCSRGYVTIGYGRKLSNTKYAPLPAIVANEKEELEFVRKRINQNITELTKAKPLAWSKCSPQRQAMLISLCYQLGLTGVLNFKKMWAAIESENFEEASKQMLDSLWAKQTRNRALRHAKTMKEGSLDMYYVSNGVFQ